MRVNKHKLPGPTPGIDVSEFKIPFRVAVMTTIYLVDYGIIRKRDYARIGLWKTPLCFLSPFIIVCLNRLVKMKFFQSFAVFLSALSSIAPSGVMAEGDVEYQRLKGTEIKYQGR